MKPKGTCTGKTRCQLSLRLGIHKEGESIVVFAIGVQDLKLNAHQLTGVRKV